MDTEGPSAFIGRQPILDRRQQLCAYELLFRSSSLNAAQFEDGRAATATVIRNLFSELSIRDVLGPYRGFINVDGDLLFSDVLELLPTETVALEILETVMPTPEVTARCAELKARGFSLALDDVTQLDDAHADILPYIDVVKIDLVQTPADRLATLIAAIQRHGKQVLAEKIDTQEQMQRCHDLGCDFFQGYYFARPVIIQGRKLDHSQLALLNLINLIVADAETPQIEEVFKREPGLTLNLLRLTNSVACGLSVRVTSLRHAITLIGRRQLQRWLQLLLFTAGAANGLSPLLQLAATRGRLMELLAARIVPDDRGFADHAFMTGILSLTPALLGQPIDQILASLTLHRDVQDALCRHNGRLGDLLGLTELLEDNPHADSAPVENLLQRLPGLRPAEINLQVVKAMAWANGIARESLN
jgi:EAL and modified HD-GYP domain-containing signal transduction protein